MTDSRTTGYDIVNIGTGEREVFLREDEKCGSEKIGKFTICLKGLGNRKYNFNLSGSPEYSIVIIDEVGSAGARG